MISTKYYTGAIIQLNEKCIVLIKLHRIVILTIDLNVCKNDHNEFK